jgi:hypothetical protein
MEGSVLLQVMAHLYTAQKDWLGHECHQWFAEIKSLALRLLQIYLPFNLVSGSDTLPH